MKKSIAIIILCITPFIVFAQQEKVPYAVVNTATLFDDLKIDPSLNNKEKSLLSIDTKHTIMKVRTAIVSKKEIIIGSSYDGVIIAVDYNGKTLWENNVGEGIINHDLWCDDITGNGNDEIIIASAKGSIICLDSFGKKRWEFKPNKGTTHLTPMYGVCTIHDSNKKAYVVGGGFDQSYYYLSSKGELVKEVKSSSYSTIKTKSRLGREVPPTKTHNINFIRPLKRKDGSEFLSILATNNHMQSRGVIYLFNPLENLPFATHEITPKVKVLGSFNICDTDNDGNEEVLIGTSDLVTNAMITYNPSNGKMNSLNLKKQGKSGYRVTKTVTIPHNKSFLYFTLCGNYLNLITPSLDSKSKEIIIGNYAFNDIWKDKTERVLLASSQSGGSCIHIINTKLPHWKKEFENLSPPGKIKSILTNTASCRKALKNYNEIPGQNKSAQVYSLGALSAKSKGNELVNKFREKYNNPIFLKRVTLNKENWDRSVIGNKTYETKRDRRMKYTMSQSQIINKLSPLYKGDDTKGITYWVGHGNDPYMYNPQTTKKVLDAANGKMTAFILPELGGTGDQVAFLTKNFLNPIASYAAKKNGIIFFRSKNIFWSGDFYLPQWKEALSGKFASSFVPSMEETTDKTMEISLAGRIGLWAAGSFNSWGMRCSRDNPSFDRARQISYQRLPNHFLRTMVYSLAYGAQYMENTYVDKEYMSLAWDLVGKGVLYVPKREEILSFSPVHISMKEPDEAYLREGTLHKWTTFYKPEEEEKRQFVFGRIMDHWLGAPNNKWDFSSYAAGVKDRRQNFIPPFSKGMVLITPPQKGIFANRNEPKGLLVDHLHPIYKNILKEYITDGHHYFSANGKETYKANEYYTHIEKEIKASAKKLPLTVSGKNVGWVVAQTSPTHLRLTLVDGGYINPDNRKASITFHTIQPTKVTDLLSKELITTNNSSTINIEVPCGLFRFIDIELKEPLK